MRAINQLSRLQFFELNKEDYMKLELTELSDKTLA